MKRSVKLFARAKDLAGADVVEIELPETSRVADLRDALAQAVPALAAMIPALLIAIDNEYASDDSPIGTAGEIACFPPVSGG